MTTDLAHQGKEGNFKSDEPASQIRNSEISNWTAPARSTVQFEISEFRI